MRSLLSLAAMGVSVALATPVPADDPDPFGWTERCLISSKNQLDWVSRREDCLQAILIYCEFAQDDQACFQNLTENFDRQSERLITSLPVSIEASAPQKQFFEMRLNLLSEMTPGSHCPDKEQGDLCTATISIQRYLAAASLADWIAEQEGKQ